MSSLQFMNQDGEWEHFPNNDELYEKKRQRDEVLDAMQVRILCHLCNEPVPKEQLAFWVEGQALTWSCIKCSAISESKPQV